jgi:hypothetical protein
MSEVTVTVTVAVAVAVTLPKILSLLDLSDYLIDCGLWNMEYGIYCCITVR